MTVLQNNLIFIIHDIPWEKWKNKITSKEKLSVHSSHYCFFTSFSRFILFYFILFYFFLAVPPTWHTSQKSRKYWWILQLFSPHPSFPRPIKLLDPLILFLGGPEIYCCSFSRWFFFYSNSFLCLCLISSISVSHSCFWFSLKKTIFHRQRLLKVLNTKSNIQSLLVIHFLPCTLFLGRVSRILLQLLLGLFNFICTLDRKTVEYCSHCYFTCNFQLSISGTKYIFLLSWYIKIPSVTLTFTKTIFNKEFFQALAMSVLLCCWTIRTHMKYLQKMLYGKYTRILNAVQNKSWKQLPRNTCYLVNY